MLNERELTKVFTDNYVIVHLDVMERKDKKATMENPGADKFMADWGGEKSGLPYYAFLDGKGKKLADSNVMPKHQNIGYPGSPEEITAFQKLLLETAPRMKASDRERVIAYLKGAAPPAPTAPVSQPR